MDINLNPLAPVFSLGEKLIDKFTTSPEQKAEATRELLALQQSGELKKLEIGMSAILAEAQSKDPWTSRARPSFMYLFYSVIIVLVIIAPFVGVFYPEQMTQFYINVKSGFDAIPEAMWWTFTTGFLGYAGLRTHEKGKGVTK